MRDGGDLSGGLRESDTGGALMPGSMAAVESRSRLAGTFAAFSMEGVVVEVVRGCGRLRLVTDRGSYWLRCCGVVLDDVREGERIRVQGEPRSGAGEAVVFRVLSLGKVEVL